MRYGGNTTCVEVRSDPNDLVIFDAGTGLRELGRSLVGRSNGQPIRGDLLFSHAHWDHIHGLPFFPPAFQPGNHFRLWGSPSLERNLEVVLRQQMSPVVFPVAFDQLRARMEFQELRPAQVVGGSGSLDVQCVSVRHPGGALGFRVAPAGDPSRAIVFIPDNELDRDGDLADDASSRDTLVAFARGARYLIHDAMYTGTEYMHHRGWGHSSYRDAVDFAIAAEVETLVLFHHDPDRSDGELEAECDRSRSMVRERGGSVAVVAAAEGLELSL